VLWTSFLKLASSAQPLIWLVSRKHKTFEYNAKSIESHIKQQSNSMKTSLNNRMKIVLSRESIAIGCNKLVLSSDVSDFFGLFCLKTETPEKIDAKTRRSVIDRSKKHSNHIDQLKYNKNSIENNEKINSRCAETTRVFFFRFGFHKNRKQKRKQHIAIVFKQKLKQHNNTRSTIENTYKETIQFANKLQKLLRELTAFASSN
jgi:hypothetical protein